MRGRKPKPSRLKMITGNPGRRKSQTVPPAGAGLVDDDPPVKLDELERLVYGWAIKDLRGTGLAGATNPAALIAFCMAVARLFRLRIARGTSSPTYMTDGGLIKANPIFGMESTACGDVARLAGELGISNASKMRLGQPSEKDRDPLTEYLADGEAARAARSGK